MRVDGGTPGKKEEGQNENRGSVTDTVTRTAVEFC